MKRRWDALEHHDFPPLLAAAMSDALDDPRPSRARARCRRRAPGRDRGRPHDGGSRPALRAPARPVEHDRVALWRNQISVDRAVGRRRRRLRATERSSVRFSGAGRGSGALVPDSGSACPTSTRVAGTMAGANGCLLACPHEGRLLDRAGVPVACRGAHRPAIRGLVCGHSRPHGRRFARGCHRVATDGFGLRQAGVDDEGGRRPRPAGNGGGAESP